MIVNKKWTMSTRSVAMGDLYGLIIAPLKDSGSTANLLELEFSGHLNPILKPLKDTGNKIDKQTLLFSE